MKPYRTPILTGVFYFFGIVSLFLAAAGFVFAFRDRDAATITFVQAISLFFGGLIQIGFAQVVDFLGRTAHYTEKMAGTLRETSHASGGEFTDVGNPPPAPQEPPDYRSMLP